MSARSRFAKCQLRVEPLEDRLAPANGTVAGALSFPFPTINNISVEWLMTGDDNLNATVAVRYRRQGDTTWSTGMNLRRIPAGPTRASAGRTSSPAASSTCRRTQPTRSNSR